MRNGRIASYPALDESVDCKAFVLGAGLSGARTAWELAQAGLHAVVVNEHDVAPSSTSVVSTCLLPYDVDTPLRRLARRARISALGKLPRRKPDQRVATYNTPLRGDSEARKLVGHETHVYPPVCLRLPA